MIHHIAPPYQLYGILLGSKGFETLILDIKGCDIVFCCNVLIYFDIPSKQKVVANLYDTINKGGYLLIGYSESLHGVSKAFKLIHLPKVMTYKKE